MLAIFRQLLPCTAHRSSRSLQASPSASSGSSSSHQMRGMGASPARGPALRQLLSHCNQSPDPPCFSPRWEGSKQKPKIQLPKLALGHAELVVEPHSRTILTRPFALPSHLQCRVTRESSSWTTTLELPNLWDKAAWDKGW